jgi:hypothetical protein
MDAQTNPGGAGNSFWEFGGGRKNALEALCRFISVVLKRQVWFSHPFMENSSW